MAIKSVYDPVTNTTSSQYVPDPPSTTPAAPTSQPVSSQPTTQSITETTNKILGGNYFNTSTGAQVAPYVPPAVTPTINSTNLAATTTPTIPAPTAPVANSTFVNSLQAEVDKNKADLQAAYKAQQAQIALDKQLTQAKIDNFTTLQKTGVIDQVDELTKPFRADLEAAQRKELYINDNFEANQKLTNELDSLLTQGNEIIKQQKAEGGLSSIATANLNKTISDVNARAGVIQAVMSARNGQISQAYTMIDRTVNAINADRQDRLDYFKTLYNFYGDQKSAEQTKLATLNNDEKTYINAQIRLLENDLKQTQANAEKLKASMTDPDTALAYANAGVTLNDTPEQINTKLAKYAVAKQVQDTSKDMAQKGYTAVIPGQKPPAGSDIVTTTDINGITKQWYKVLTAAERLDNENKRLQNLKLSGEISTPASTNSATAGAYAIANDILNSGNIKNITGLQSLEAIIPGSATQYTKNQYEQLQAFLSLENRSKLKGSGAISDYESKVLESASSALGRNLSEADFTKELKKVRGVLGAAAGYPVTVVVRNPTTGEAKAGTLDRNGINSAITQGFLIEYQ